ncbi:MAG TPA: helix-turn-helix transcriptional regulator [Candidatus Krumholzibacteria bacterium]
MVVGDRPIDLWASVPLDHLPRPLVDGFERKDWVATREELRKVMDGVVTDGVYGRALLNLVLRLPIGVDPLFDRYRGMVSCDFGDWDGLQQCLEIGSPGDPIEIRGLRDIILAPVSQVGMPTAFERHHILLFRAYETLFAQLPREYLRWAREIQHFRPAQLWARGDMPLTRHVRYRQLHDLLANAVGESQAGRLPVALSFVIDAQRVGVEDEPLRATAVDLEPLVAAAMGDSIPGDLASWDSIRRPTGLSPLASWQSISYLLPLVAASQTSSLTLLADVAEHIATGLGSARAHLVATAWRVAAQLVQGAGQRPRELPGLLAQARTAGPGLRVLPQILHAIVDERPSEFMAAERAARRVGNVWAQVTALVWATALSPQEYTARRLHQLLDVTGWRRPSLVPPEIAADAALGLATVGVRGRSVIELAAVAGRPNVTLEIAKRHIEEPGVAREHKFHALDALAALGTTHAEELLRRTALRRDEIGQRAGGLLRRPSHPLGLSEREVEVLQLAGSGHTNREIASKLTLSPHTIARHVSNAREKLGASNRAEAATRLAGLRSRASSNDE